MRVEPIPAQWVHIDVLVSILAPKLAAVCVEAASGGLVAWLRSKGFEIVEVSLEDALTRRRQRDLARRRPRHLHLEVRAPERCAPQPRDRGARPRPRDVHPRRRRRPLPGAGAAPRPRLAVADPGPAVDAARVIADLRELDRRTGGEGGARRVAWTEEWRAARAWFAELVAELGLEPRRDAAGNVRVTLEGESRPGLAVGSHLDSVTDGGWLDGALGVMAGLGVLRAWAESGERPPRDLVLVDWADEEGSRFGYSLFGSSAFAGTLDLEVVRPLRDHDGVALADALAENGVELDAAGGRGVVARGDRRLPRAPHRAGPGARVRVPAGRRGRRLRGDRALPPPVRGPGVARGHHPDGPPPRRRPRGGRDDPRDRAARQGARGQGHVRRAGAAPGDHHGRRGRGRAGRRPAPRRRRGARLDARAGAGGGRGRGRA